MKPLSPEERALVIKAIEKAIEKQNKTEEKINSKVSTNFLVMVKSHYTPKENRPNIGQEKDFQSLVSTLEKPENIKSMYLEGNRSKHSILNVIQNRYVNKISKNREKQLTKLEEALKEATTAYRAVKNPNNTDELKSHAEQEYIKIMTPAIEGLKAELKKEHNYAGSRMDNMLTTMEKQIIKLQTSIPGNVLVEENTKKPPTGKVR